MKNDIFIVIITILLLVDKTYKPYSHLEAASSMLIGDLFSVRLDSVQGQYNCASVDCLRHECQKFTIS